MYCESAEAFRLLPAMQPPPPPSSRDSPKHHGQPHSDEDEDEEEEEEEDQEADLEEEEEDHGSAARKRPAVAPWEAVRPSYRMYRATLDAFLQRGGGAASDEHARAAPVLALFEALQLAPLPGSPVAAAIGAVVRDFAWRRCGAPYAGDVTRASLPSRVLTGDVEECAKFLRRAPAMRALREAAVLAQLLERMPRPSAAVPARRFRLDWAQWQRSAQHYLGDFAARSGAADRGAAAEDEAALRLAARIVCGTVEAMHAAAAHWLELLCGLALFACPPLRRADVPALLADARAEWDRLGARPAAAEWAWFAEVFAAAADLRAADEALAVVARHFRGCDWLLAHLVDAAVRRGRVAVVHLPGAAHDLRSLFLLRYALALAERPGTLRLCVPYLDACGAAGRAALRLVLARQPAPTLAALVDLTELCDELRLYDVGRTARRSYALLLWRVHRDVHAAVYWLLAAHEYALAARVLLDAFLDPAALRPQLAEDAAVAALALDGLRAMDDAERRAADDADAENCVDAVPGACRPAADLRFWGAGAGAGTVRAVFRLAVAYQRASELVAAGSVQEACNAFATPLLSRELPRVAWLPAVAQLLAWTEPGAASVPCATSGALLAQLEELAAAPDAVALAAELVRRGHPPVDLAPLRRALAVSV